VIKVLVATLSALLLASTVGSGSALAGQNVQVERLAGATRYETAAAAAAATSNGRPPEQRGAAMLARADDFPDGLTAANLGDVPLFLTESARLTPATRSAMQSQGIGFVYVVGGRSAVSDNVLAELHSSGIQTERIAGTDRYDTSRATYNRFYSIEGEVPNEVDGKRTLLVASGERFADALAGAPLAAGANLPILLTAFDSMPERTRSAFDKGCPNGLCIEQAIILGGTESVSINVENQLTSMGVTVRRLAGTARQGTATAIADFAIQELGWTIEHFNLTRGDKFPDALASGPLGGAEHAPTLLAVDPDTLGAATRDFLASRASDIQSFHVLGDETAVSAVVVDQARAASTG